MLILGRDFVEVWIGWKTQSLFNHFEEQSGFTYLVYMKLYVYQLIVKKSKKLDI